MVLQYLKSINKTIYNVNSAILKSQMDRNDNYLNVHTKRPIDTNINKNDAAKICIS